jgi:CO dehydrogenase maturation factor
MERREGAMKIAITGKGGTGKTTVAGILGHCFKDKGYDVLAVDADPDANLASALGLPPEISSKIRPISEQRLLIKERTGANPRQFGQLFKLNPKVSDIPDDFCVEFQGIKLLVMGAVRTGGEGCACPENVLLKNLLSELILRRKEVVIVDMEAGIEHMGRATAQSIDRMLIVVEPGSRSVQTAQTILKMGKDIGVPSFGIIGNKIRSNQQRDWTAHQFPKDMLLGTISYDESIQNADLMGTSLTETISAEVTAEFQTIFKILLASS